MAVNVLAEVSEKLLAVVLSCRVIAGILDGSDSSLSLLAFQRDKANLLRTQIEIMENLELKEMLARMPVSKSTRYDTEPNAPARFEPDDREKKLRRLNEKVWEIKNKYHQDALLLERLQTGTFLLRHLFPTRPAEKYPDLDRLVEAQTNCSLKVLSEVDKVQLMQKEVESIQQERAGVMLKCRQLSMDIKSLTSSVHVMPKLAVLLKKAVDRHNLLRQTLQCLIVSSEVDWSEDEELLQLVLALGQPLSIEHLSGYHSNCS